jgi:Holliday junction resolvasome RuvABC DNA-binding subunit
MAEPDGIDGTGNGYEKGSPARLRRTLDKFWSTDMYAGASKVDEIRKITAGMTLDEFELSVEALLDFGYTDKQIMQTFEKIAECDDVFGSTGAVAAVAKTFGETSEASKHGLR